MNSRQFHQAGMKKCQAGKEEMQCRRQCRDQEFRYGIAKFRYGLIFSMIAKFRYSNFLYTLS